MLQKQILNYKIIREIGSGGMATVYEAVHVKLDTKVAIKVLNPVLSANDGIRKRFEQEAKIMALLNHEGITKVIDFDEEENRLAIVMEYLNGQTLDEYINQKGALCEEEATKLFITILEAFSYAHKKSIVHRDVKPSNIFITTEGKVKIMDFGIAKIVEDGANVLTQTGTQMGTPVYMSQEQVNDSKNIDHRTDIYSLGIVLWYMLQGKPPYDGNQLSSFQIFTKIVNEPVSELLIYPKMDKIITKATAKDSHKRFKKCEEFVSEFISLDYKLKLDIQVDNNEILNGRQETLINENNVRNDNEKVVEKVKVESIDQIKKKNKLLIPIISFFVVAVVIILIFVFMPNEQDHWQTTQEQNTISAYEKYLADYPHGNYTIEANDQIETFIWEDAKDKNTIESYQRFLSDYPESEYNKIAQNILGEIFYYGKGVKKNYTKAVNWYMKSAEQDYASAQFYLGVMYEIGEGVEKDYTTAVNWYRKAAEQGYASAQCYLGVMYEIGTGVEKDYTIAVNWYRKSAEQGNASAQYYLGGKFYYGIGVKKDYTKALNWFRKAAEQGDASAQYYLGEMFYFGIGVKKDYTKAVSWCRNAADQGNASAQYILGYMYESGEGVEKNRNMAIDLYEKSAAQENENAIKSLHRLK
jgi:TPR repeat protein